MITWLNDQVDSASKGNAVCTAAILDFLSCQHQYKGVKPFQKGVSGVNDPSALEVSF